MVPWTHRTICSLEPWTMQACSLTQSRLTLHHPIDYSPPGSSVRGIFQARILEQVAIFSSRESSWPRIKLTSPVAPALAGKFFTTEPPGKPTLSHQFRSVAQSCLTLCDPMNRSTPGLPVHHQLPEFTQTHVHRVGDAIQPSHPLSPPSPPAPNPS